MTHSADGIVADFGTTEPSLDNMNICLKNNNDCVSFKYVHYLKNSSHKNYTKKVTNHPKFWI